jgi:hypothetical protein
MWCRTPATCDEVLEIEKSTALQYFTRYGNSGLHGTSIQQTANWICRHPIKWILLRSSNNLRPIQLKIPILRHSSATVDPAAVSIAFDTAPAMLHNNSRLNKIYKQMWCKLKGFWTTELKPIILAVKRKKWILKSELNLFVCLYSVYCVLSQQNFKFNGTTCKIFCSTSTFKFNCY